MPLTRYEHISGSARDNARAEVAKRYAEGETVRDIASDLGRSYGFVHRLLIESGEPLRSRGARTKTAAAHEEIPGQTTLDLEASA